jgi:1-acyl-sn-glycerol-3-phosphate acyltransferase
MTGKSPKLDRFGLPEISPWLHRWFAAYSKRYLRKHFNAVRLLGTAPPPLPSGRPVVFFLNHASWWDPLVALFLCQQFFSQFRSYAPIDADALKRYGFLKRLGFFPVERGSIHGARQFFGYSREILAKPNHALWLTPQGRFSDMRERPVRFESGIGHLADLPTSPLLIPIAIEYVWWFERSPEILVSIGEPLNDFGSDEPTRRCEVALTQLQDELAAASLQRDDHSFTVLLDGCKGVGGIYDLWRRWKSRLQGKSFSADHHST